MDRETPGTPKARAIELPPASALLSHGEWAKLLAKDSGDTNVIGWLLDLDRAIGPALQARDSGGTPIRVVRGTFPAYWLLAEEIGAHLRRKGYEVTHSTSLREDIDAAQPSDVEPRVVTSSAQADHAQSHASLTAGEIAYAFRDIGYTQENWMAALQDPPKWLAPLKLSPGRRGNHPQQSTWDALGVAKALAAKSGKHHAERLRARFKSETLLAHFRAAWDEFDLQFLRD